MKSYTINPKRGRRVSESTMKKESARLNKVLKKKQIEQAYKTVIKDLRSRLTPCEDKSPICFTCVTKRMSDDLEILFDVLKFHNDDII